MKLNTYETARYWAEKRANEWQVSQGIEKMSGGWIVRCIPRADKRFGCDATCEAVEPTYNFMPSEPASCIAQGRGGEGVYAQRGCWWYFDGRNGAVQIPMLGHLNGAELLSLGRDTLSKRLRSGAGW